MGNNTNTNTISLPDGNKNNKENVTLPKKQKLLTRGTGSKSLTEGFGDHSRCLTSKLCLSSFIKGKMPVKCSTENIETVRSWWKHTLQSYLAVLLVQQHNTIKISSAKLILVCYFPQLYCSVPHNRPLPVLPDRQWLTAPPVQSDSYLAGYDTERISKELFKSPIDSDKLQVGSFTPPVLVTTQLNSEKFFLHQIDYDGNSMKNKTQVENN